MPSLSAETKIKTQDSRLCSASLASVLEAEQKCWQFSILFLHLLHHNSVLLLKFRTRESKDRIRGQTFLPFPELKLVLEKPALKKNWEKRKITTYAKITGKLLFSLITIKKIYLELCLLSATARN